MKQKSAARHGFTLVELSLVVALLAIVAFIAVNRLSRVSATARDVAAEAAMKTIKNAFLADDGGYVADLGGIPGFSPAYMRIGNLFVSTNVFGCKVVGGGTYGTETRGIRLDTGYETEASCAAEHRAMPSAFTSWDEVRHRGWRGPYVTDGAHGFFPSRDGRRFEGDSTFEERNFFPPVTNLRLPMEFKDADKASVYGFVGEPTLIDPWGNPYVLQIPPPQAFPGVTNVADEVRFSYARVVSAGPDGVLDTPCFLHNSTNWYATAWTERTRRLVRQAGLIDGSDRTARGDDFVLFLKRSDIDEGESW